ncbi:MAG: sulfatase-like hydrolase/transferase [Myxococcota bacterium]|nr:sulfatase-like hydrolase/transferase [Myxococcota bacterium]
MNTARMAILGALVGLYEAIAIVRWDWLMDDVRLWRLALGIGYGLVIVAINAGLFALLHTVLRRSVVATSVVYTAFVFGARYVGEDRFETTSFYAAGAVLVLVLIQRLWSWSWGLLAVALATPGLWGRVPVYTTAVDEQIAFLLPGALITVLVGVAVNQPRIGSSRWMSGTAIVAGLVGLIGAAIHTIGVNPSGSEKPNVLFVLVDTLRQDHVEPYGDATPTPGITRLSAEGTRYDDAITVIPKTTQSVAAFQTGKYPVTNGVRILKDSLGADQETLAETLSANGYSTAAFVHNGWVMRGRGFEQGFDQFWSFFELERAWGPARLSGWVTAIDTFTTRRIRPFDGNTDARVATNRIVDWMRNAPQPFYGYVHYFDPHWPYRPPGEDGECKVNNIQKIKRISRGEMMFKNPLSDEENERACELYRKEVTYNADQVGRMLDALDEMGVADNTIVIFTADHGHSLGEHDYWYHHGEFLYDASMAIPLIIKAPGMLEAGAINTDPVRSIDVMPTILGMANIAIPEGDGVDLRVERPGAAFMETDISYFKWNKRRYIKGVNGKLRGVRTGDWKLIYTPKKGRGVWELFNLKDDPEELTNLFETGEAPKGISEALMAELRTWIPEDEQLALNAIGNRFDVLPTNAKVTDDEPGDAEDATSDEELSETERRMLQALGYVE